MPVVQSGDPHADAIRAGKSPVSFMDQISQATCGKLPIFSQGGLCDKKEEAWPHTV